MSDTTDGTPAKRRGRRPAGQDTRAALLDAAREVFGESGYDGATVRAIATRAGVDAAMVNHWFGGKEQLFANAVLQLPFDPVELLAGLVKGDPDTLGERIVRTFVTRWDGAGGDIFTALIRSVAGHEQATSALREVFLKRIMRTVVTEVATDSVELRAGLCASQMVGLGFARYVIGFDPIARADVDELAAAIGPTLQRYLRGPLT